MEKTQKGKREIGEEDRKRCQTSTGKLSNWRSASHWRNRKWKHSASKLWKSSSKRATFNASMLPSLYVLLFFECLPFAMWGKKPAANVTFGLIFEVYYWFWFIITWCFTPNSDQSLFTEILNSKFEFRVFFFIYIEMSNNRKTPENIINLVIFFLLHNTFNCIPKHTRSFVVLILRFLTGLICIWKAFFSLEKFSISLLLISVCLYIKFWYKCGLCLCLIGTRREPC